MKKSADIAAKCIEKALKIGADAADAVIFDSFDISVRERMGKLENVESSESTGLGLRVMVAAKEGFRQAVVSSNDLKESVLDELVERAVAMAKVAPSDKHIRLASKDEFAKNSPELDLSDKTEKSPEDIKKWVNEAESAALGIKGVTNSDGADASYSRGKTTLVTSNGFSHEYMVTSFSVSVSVIAGKDTNMETDYDYSVARHFENLKKPADIGRMAGERAVRKLKPRKVKTCQVPVVFESRVAKSLLGNLSSAINGASISRGTSFLKNKLGEKIFGDGVDIIDDPLIKRGIASEPYDAEAISGKKIVVVENGVLKAWLLDIRSASQLGLISNGRASRGISSPPSPDSTNFYLAAGKLSPVELMADIKNGFYVTDVFGMGVNGVTGDYSQGAAGFWIENGKVSYPVSEVTIAGNLKDMYRNLIPANDLEFLYSTNSPTVRIDGMTIAGA